jgi:bifunctional DNA-binding transcriptional regulator/antitoxin component of YhaV-PrlF toxin-antitoxin module
MTVTLKNKTPLVVPNRVRREAGFKTGDRVEFKVSRGVVTILPKPAATENPDDSLTPAEAKKVRHALKQVRDGKTKPWSQVKRTSHPAAFR